MEQENEFNWDRKPEEVPAQKSNFGSELAHRESIRDRVEKYLIERRGQWVCSFELHDIFGSGARTRISEIRLNKNGKSLIDIFHKESWDGKKKLSYYRGELRKLNTKGEKNNGNYCK